MTPLASGQAMTGNFEMTPGNLPEWIELLPPGREIVGRDGRIFLNADPDGVVKSLQALGVDLVVDVEHATELRAPKGEPAPAAGWVSAYEHRGSGAIWGKVTWTPRGREAVTNREYRYLSPVILYARATGIIHSLGSVALTNKPNLQNTALNHAAGLNAMVSLSEDARKIAAMFGNDPAEIAAAMAGGARNAEQSPNQSDNAETIRKLMGVSKADADRETARHERQDLVAKKLTDQEIDLCQKMGVDPMGYWEERVKAAGLNPKQTTFTGYKYDEDGKRL